MASALTYADFAAQLPHLAVGDADVDVSARRAAIVTFIDQAELHVSRSLFGTTVPPGASISRADLAVLLMAGHLYRHYLRSVKTQGEVSVGQVVSIQDDTRSVSYAAIAGNSSTNTPATQFLATTPEGLRFIALRDSLPTAALPFTIL